MKIVLTDADYKHSLALAKYINIYDQDVKLSGFAYKNKSGALRNLLFKFLYGRFYSELIFDDLEATLNKEDFDLIIPVGAKSVEKVAKHPTHKKYLPPLTSIELCLDKGRTVDLAHRLNIPAPKTIILNSADEIKKANIVFPCVLKSNLETDKKLVLYADNKDELEKHIAKFILNTGRMPIIQEYSKGAGAGFFAFYQEGELKRFYMHKRLREYPVTGGPSTAAETFYHDKIFEYGKKLLDELRWNGVAMVEFKYDRESGNVCLMEINPKFWGSLELGLAAGINFGELIIRAYKGENIKSDLSADSYKKIKFYWPLDEDILSIIKSKKYKAILDYWKPDYKTNMGTGGTLLNIFKFSILIKKLIA